MTQEIHKATFYEYYGAIFKKRSAEELRVLAHIKRFMETFAGNPEFRAELKKSPDNAGDIASGLGLEIKPMDIYPIWAKGFQIKIEKEELEKYPKASLWSAWIKDLIQFREMITESGGQTVSAKFGAWRQRQMERCKTELGDSEGRVTHATACFELSQGCSVGCWFCGLNAGKLQEIFHYSSDNAGLWRDVLDCMNAELGASMQSAFCYWATEPSDNPDYTKFLLDFKTIVGLVPQTTTSQPLRDINWTRGVMDLFEPGTGIPPRFSVLSRRQLEKIHEQFTPEELLLVELIQQHEGSIILKSKVGRAKGKDLKLPEELKGQAVKDKGTIACVSGFLINMCERRIRLVTPCSSSEEWPLGFKVLSEGEFSSGADVQRFIQEAVAEYMEDHIPSDVTLSFRDDLKYEEVEDGFSLVSDFTKNSLKGRKYLNKMGNRIHSGKYSTSDIIGSALSEGASIFGVTADLQNLFDKGFLYFEHKRVAENV